MSSRPSRYSICLCTYFNSTFRSVEHSHYDILPRLGHPSSLELLCSQFLQDLECLLALGTPLWRKVDDLHHVQRNTTYKNRIKRKFSITAQCYGILPVIRIDYHRVCINHSFIPFAQVFVTGLRRTKRLPMS